MSEAAPVRAFALLLLLASVPLAAAADGPDAHVHIPATGPVTSDVDWFNVSHHDAGQNVTWHLDVPDGFQSVAIEVDAGAFDLAWNEQLMPLLFPDADDPACVDSATSSLCAYPLFERFRQPDVWSADAARLVNHSRSSNGTLVVTLGIPGPLRANLSLLRDVAPPNLSVGLRSNITSGGFFQETRTDELAIADLMWRPIGTTEWVHNPTPAYHTLQRFPIQGMDPETEYEISYLTHDWAGNVVRSETSTFTTPAAPIVSVPRLEVLSPAPNATLTESDLVVVRVRVSAEASPLQTVRIFFDLEEVRDGAKIDGDVLEWRPDAVIAAGRHVVRVEAVNAAGGEAAQSWSFTIAGAATPSQNTPAPPALLLVALVGSLALMRQRRREGA